MAQDLETGIEMVDVPQQKIFLCMQDDEEDRFVIVEFLGDPKDADSNDMAASKIDTYCSKASKLRAEDLETGGIEMVPQQKLCLCMQDEDEEDLHGFVIVEFLGCLKNGCLFQHLKIKSG
jgi:hypothetical protein